MEGLNLTDTMDFIKNFGSKALTHLEVGKHFAKEKLSVFKNRIVSYNSNQNLSQKESIQHKKTSVFRQSIHARLIHFKENIVSKISFSKTDAATTIVSTPQTTHTESLKGKSLHEILALPFPKDAKGFSERIQFLEENSKSETLSTQDKLVLKTELEHLKFLHSEGPLSLAMHKKAMQFKQAAAESVLNHLIQAKQTVYHDHLEAITPNIENAKKAIQAYFENKQRAMEAALNDGKMGRSHTHSDHPPYKALQNDIKNANRDVAKILMDHNLHTPGTQLDALTKIIENTHNKVVLNTQPWEPIAQTIYCYKRDGSAHKFASVVTPALHLGSGLDYSDISLDDAKSTVLKKENGMVHLEGKKICGLSSEMQHSKHAVNLWKSDLFMEGYDGQPKHLGSLFRHGVLCAYQDTSDYRRKDKNLNRAKEVVTAMVHSSLKEQVAQLKEGETLTVPIVSTNLQSASDAVDWVKRFLKPSMNEKVHVNEQMQAWRDLEKAGPFSLEVDGKIIKVQPKPIAFNFGVNILAVRKKTKILRTWSSVKQANREAMEALLGKDYLSATLADDKNLEKSLLLPEQDAQGNANEDAIKKNAAIKALALQIHEIYKSDAYQAQGVDPYKLVARISALAILSGKQASINCKSGKDRTSTCDAEIKHILTTIAMHDPLHDHGSDLLPPYDQKLNDKARKNYQNFIFAKGNFAIQEKNTGIAGYKCGGVPALFEKIGDGSSFLRDLFLGGSAVTKV